MGYTIKTFELNSLEEKAIDKGDVDRLEIYYKYRIKQSRELSKAMKHTKPSHGISAFLDAEYDVHGLLHTAQSRCMLTADKLFREIKKLKN